MLKGFCANDFARLRPASALGRKLSLRVADVIESGGRPVVVVHPHDLMRSGAV